MADIPKISDELLLRAFARPSLGQTLQSGMEGFGQGVDIGSKLAERKSKQKKEEQDLIQQIEQLKLQRTQQNRQDQIAKAGLVPSKLSPTGTDITPEVFRVLQPEKPEKTAVPTGYRFKADGSLEPIPGSEAAVKREKESKAEKSTFEQHLGKAKLAKSFVEQAIPKVSAFTAGPGSYLSVFPGSPSRNLQSDIQEIKSRIGLDALMAAKATSPTGASGFGQLSDKEMEILQAQVANLDQARSPEQLREKLTTVVKHYNNVLALLQGENPYSEANPAPSMEMDLSSLSTEDLFKKLAGGK